MIIIHVRSLKVKQIVGVGQDLTPDEAMVAAAAEFPAGSEQGEITSDPPDSAVPQGGLTP